MALKATDKNNKGNIFHHSAAECVAGWQGAVHGAESLNHIIKKPPRGLVVMNS